MKNEVLSYIAVKTIKSIFFFNLLYTIAGPRKYVKKFPVKFVTPL